MKTLLLTGVLAISSLATLEKAEAFPVSMGCSVYPTHAQCTVVNGFNRTIGCNMAVAGRSYYGLNMAASASATVFPGTYASAFISAYPGDPIVWASAGAECVFL